MGSICMHGDERKCRSGRETYHFKNIEIGVVTYVRSKEILN